MFVDVSGLSGFVAEPDRDRRDVHALGPQEHRVRVAQSVRRGVFGRERRVGGARRGDMAGEDRADGVAAERTALPGREQGLVGLAVQLVDPCGQDRDRLAGQRR